MIQCEMYMKRIRPFSWKWLVQRYDWHLDESESQLCWNWFRKNGWILALMQTILFLSILKICAMYILWMRWQCMENYYNGQSEGQGKLLFSLMRFKRLRIGKSASILFVCHETAVFILLAPTQNCYSANLRYIWLVVR